MTTILHDYRTYQLQLESRLLAIQETLRVMHAAANDVTADEWLTVRTAEGWTGELLDMVQADYAARVERERNV